MSKYEVDFLGQLDWFSPDFFLQIGPEQANYSRFKQFALDYQLFIKK